MTPATILLVDDDPIVRAVVRAQLEALGHVIVEESDGDGAIARLSSSGAELLLLDLQLPGTDGFGVLAHLRAASAAASLPTIVLTGHGSDDEARRALLAGAVDVVRKPVAPHELAARIDLVLRASRAERQVADLRRELTKATRTDGLTGLANRTHIDEHLGMASSAARRHRQPLSLLLVDIDHLRRVNDAEGTPAGDAVLRAVATRLHRVLRGEDMAGRWGSEEFLAIAPATDLDGAWRLGERIRAAIADQPVVFDNGHEVLVTVSIGCATGEGDDLDDHLRRIDRALELAKQGGRNRVCTDAALAP